MARFDLTDAEWTIIAPLLPGARQEERPAAAGRSQGSQRHLLRAAHRHAVARSAGTLRPLHDRVQPLQSLGQGGHLASDIRGSGGEIAAVAAPDRQLDHPGPPARRGR